MNRIDRLFQEKQQGIVSIYFTAGYPALDDTSTIIEALQESGADLIEIGMPYSDPMADGPTIQDSGSQAIENGMTLRKLFDQLTTIRDRVDLPLLLMGYLNQIMQFGLDAFVAECQRVGIDGLIIPDLPIDIYDTEFRDKLTAANLHTIFLITPQTSDDRIRYIDNVSRGFIYMVSNASITGAKSNISDRQVAYFQRIDQMNLTNPRLIGFGISNHETYQRACAHAQGVIIGSAYIKMLTRSKDDIRKGTADFIRMIKAGQ